MTFDHWEITGTDLTSGSESSATISFKADGDVTIRAVYTGQASVTTPSETTATTTKATTTTTTTTVTTTVTSASTSAESTGRTRPSQTTQPADTTTVSAEAGEKLVGDANLDKKVSVADAVAILQHLGNRDKYRLSEQGLVNADVDGEPGVTAKDALLIQQMDARLIDKFPVE